MTDCLDDLSNDRKINGMLSLAKKAGKVRSGEQAVTEAIDSGRVFLMLIAEDASDNTKKRFSDRCAHRGIPSFFYESMEELGKIIGTGDRSCAAVIDRGFAKAIGDLIAAKGVANG